MVSHGEVPEAEIWTSLTLFYLLEFALSMAQWKLWSWTCWHAHNTVNFLYECQMILTSTYKGPYMAISDLCIDLKKEIKNVWVLNAEISGSKVKFEGDVPLAIEEVFHVVLSENEQPWQNIYITEVLISASSWTVAWFFFFWLNILHSKFRNLSVSFDSRKEEF